MRREKMEHLDVVTTGMIEEKPDSARPREKMTEEMLTVASLHKYDKKY